VVEIVEKPRKPRKTVKAVAPVKEKKAKPAKVVKESPPAVSPAAAAPDPVVPPVVASPPEAKVWQTLFAETAAGLSSKLDEVVGLLKSQATSQAADMARLMDVTKELMKRLDRRRLPSSASTTTTTTRFLSRCRSLP